MKIHPRRRWRKTLEARGRFPPWQAEQPAWQGLVSCLGVVSSKTFLRSRHKIIPRSLLIFRSSLAVFCINPAKNINSPKLVETINLNLLFYDIHPF
jgi:hypothetical protein